MEPSPFSPADVTLAVLAGGEGSRMGQAKALLRVGDHFILDHLRLRLDWPGPTWLVTAPGREHPPGSEGFDREIIDPVAGLGPLRGVLTALEFVRTPLLAVVTVDMPGVGRGQLEWLAAQIHAGEKVGLMCRRQMEDHTLIEPFPLVLRPKAFEIVRSRVFSGRRSVYGLLEEPGFVDVAIPEAWDHRVWANLNCPTDLEDYLKHGSKDP